MVEVKSLFGIGSTFKPQYPDDEYHLKILFEGNKETDGTIADALREHNVGNVADMDLQQLETLPKFDATKVLLHNRIHRANEYFLKFNTLLEQQTRPSTFKGCLRRANNATLAVGQQLLFLFGEVYSVLSVIPASRSDLSPEGEVTNNAAVWITPAVFVVIHICTTLRDRAAQRKNKWFAQENEIRTLRELAEAVEAKAQQILLTIDVTAKLIRKLIEEKKGHTTPSALEAEELKQLDEEICAIAAKRKKTPVVRQKRKKPKPKTKESKWSIFIPRREKLTAAMNALPQEEEPDSFKELLKAYKKRSSEPMTPRREPSTGGYVGNEANGKDYSPSTHLQQIIQEEGIEPETPSTSGSESGPIQQTQSIDPGQIYFGPQCPIPVYKTPPQPGGSGAAGWYPPALQSQPQHGAGVGLEKYVKKHRAAAQVTPPNVAAQTPSMHPQSAFNPPFPRTSFTNQSPAYY